MPVLLAFSLGVTVCALLPGLPDVRLLALMLPVGVGAWRAGMQKRAWLVWSFAFVVGLGWACLRAQWRLDDMLSPSLEGKVVSVELVVRDALPVSGLRTPVDVEIETASTPLHVPGHVRLVDGRGQSWPAGSRWRVPVRLKGMHGTANTFGADLERTSWAAGSLGFAYPAGGRQRLADATGPQAMIDRLRERMARRVSHVLGNNQEAALVAALSVGVTRGMSNESRERFANTGLSHLVAISGLHIGLVAGLVALAVRHFLGWLALRRVAPKPVAVWACVMAAAAYAVLSGFAVPARRAFFMVLFVALMLASRRATSAAAILSLALAAILLADPFAVMTPGLWLSFSMVAALLLIGSGRRKARSGWRSTVAAQWATSVMSLVPVPLFFGGLPLISPVANLIAIPFVSLLLVPLSLVGSLLPFDSVLRAAGWLAGLFLQGVALLDGAPVLNVAVPPAILSVAAMAGAGWLLLPRGVPGKGLAALLLAPFLLYRPDALPGGVFRMTVLDVGQGLSVLLETTSHALLYDTGALAAGKVVLPALAGRGVGRLDRLVLSHHDTDHDGAAPALVAKMPVTGVLAGQADTWHTAPFPAEQCRPGMAWQWDGVSFEVLSPSESVSSRGKNDYSCVIRVTGRFHSALLTGDITARVEQSLSSDDSLELRSDIMTAPHHGSKTSSSDSFLARVGPKWVVVSAGFRNRYGHPHALVLERYRKAGIDVARTDLDGEVTFTAEPVMRIRRYRSDSARYWRARSSSQGDLGLHHIAFPPVFQPVEREAPGNQDTASVRLDQG
ncbi:DNA internalization-related competence protein ComEC/Rec2 [Paludibacterium paludis]|uniref:Competence protein n=1 Tax=Paludibacterium paludis TaxID=1225769 RepID=A0A918P745_9NEIS|nr:DNA internalization-related competence protein ComEC/Rec2 [Paludibacterium paludis]GGY29803.1 competence protein [Paludibacterium paludis]